MAKLSAINKNNRRIKLVNKFYSKRLKLKKTIMNKIYHHVKDNKVKKKNPK